MNFGWHRAPRSILGTIQPSDGRSSDGSAISSLTPVTTMVWPIFVRDDPDAVDIEPGWNCSVSIRMPVCQQHEPTDVETCVAPFSKFSPIWSKVAGQKLFEVGSGMQSLEYLGFQVGRVGLWDLWAGHVSHRCSWIKGQKDAIC